MTNQEPLGAIIADNITVVTAMLSDAAIEVDCVVAENADGKHPRYAHCVWHLKSYTYTSDELSRIEQGIRARADVGEFSFVCSLCGLTWLDDGPCDMLCSGEVPSFFTYDLTKRDVIGDKRKAQETLATKRGLSGLYD